MHRSRFVFLALAGAAAGDGTAAATTWMLVSPNNRPLGRAARTFDTYGECRDAVLDLRAGFAGVRGTVAAVESSGQWVWRAQVDGTTLRPSRRARHRGTPGSRTPVTPATGSSACGPGAPARSRRTGRFLSVLSGPG